MAPHGRTGHRHRRRRHARGAARARWSCPSSMGTWPGNSETGAAMTSARLLAGCDRRGRRCGALRRRPSRWRRAPTGAGRTGTEADGLDFPLLAADEQELEVAIENLDEDSRPEVPARSSLPAAIAYMLLIGYFGVAWLSFANSIDAEAHPRVAPGAVNGLVVNMVVFAVLWFVTT